MVTYVPHAGYEHGTFRVLIASAYFEPGFRGGGPVRSIVQLIDTLPIGADVLLVTADRDLGSRETYAGLSGRYIRRGRATVLYLGKFAVRPWIQLIKRLRARPTDLLYVNSLWNPRFTILPIVAARLGIFHVEQILLAPRGELASGALSLKARKKVLFLSIWQPFLIRTGVAWHAESELERTDILRRFPQAIVTVNADQSSRPDEPLDPSGPSPTVANLTFVGRISPVKNILLILDAMHHARQPMTLDIFGPIEDKTYWQQCQNSVATLPGNVSVNYRGAIAPDTVCATLSRYDALVFPTLGENFGHVIIESLSASCPVICSNFTSWNSVLLSGGGQVLKNLDDANLGEVLNTLASLGPEERMAARVAAGRAYRVWRLDQNSEPHLFEAFMAAKKQKSRHRPARGHG